MAYTVFRLNKIKSLSSLATMGHHNFRTLPSAAPKADASRTGYNKILVNPTQTNYIDMWHTREYEVNMNGGHCKPRKDSVVAYEALLTFSKDGVPEEEIDEWAKESVAWLKDTFGEANVLSAVLHMDETTPHIHAVIIPIDERDRLCAFSFTGKKSQMRDMQTSYAKRMKKFGLERGEEYGGSKLAANDIKQFYGRVEKIMHSDIPEHQQDEPVNEYVERVDNYMKTALSKAYDRELKAKRKFVEEEAIHKQVYMEYREAIKLYDALFTRCHGDKALITKELKNLTKLVDQAPLSTIDTSISYLVDKFAKNENLETYEKYKNEDTEYQMQ